MIENQWILEHDYPKGTRAKAAFVTGGEEGTVQDIVIMDCRLPGQGWNKKWYVRWVSDNGGTYYMLPHLLILI